MSRRALRAIALATFLIGCPPPAHSLGVRGDARLVASYLDHRPAVRRSVPADSARGDGIVRVLDDGTTVTCIPGEECYYYAAGGKESAAPMVQELRLSTWGAGEGISARVHLRGRAGSDGFWPASDERFLAIAAYAEADRRAYRVRLGRQEKWGGLGSYRFDGVSAAWKRIASLRVEAFVGRSLGRALVAPGIGDLLSEADELAPTGRSVLWGVDAGLTGRRGLSANAAYQRDERTDGKGTYSERASFDGRWSRRQQAAEVSIDWDIPARVLTQTQLRLSSPISRDVSVRFEGRRTRPTFDLWTIWYSFSPVGYLEERVSVSWAVRPGLRVDLEEAYRGYEDTSTESEAFPIEQDGWRFRAGGRWEREAWSSTFGYGLHQGYGAFRSRVDLSVGRRIGAQSYFGAFGSGTQQFAEFRHGEHVIWGGGIEGRARAGAVSLDGRAGLDHHLFDARPGYPDVTLARASIGLSVGFGQDPGSAVVRGRVEGAP